MQMDTSPTDRIVAWAQADDAIRAVILEGSLADGRQVDELSDYDVNVYTLDAPKYEREHAWLSQFGELLLYQNEEFHFYGERNYNALVLYRDRSRIDFSFWRPALLREMATGAKQYEAYKNGYRVLVDKDGLAAGLPAPSGTGFAVTPPPRDEFLQEIYDFWFEAYCVARYLSRGDLWYAKKIENAFIKDHLYRMILWDYGSAHAWEQNPTMHLEGKRFEKWAPPELLQEIAGIFSGYDARATWSSLYALVGSFNRLARRTADRLAIAYPAQVEAGVLEYLDFLKRRQKGN